jgi:hypothetical protein
MGAHNGHTTTNHKSTSKVGGGLGRRSSQGGMCGMDAMPLFGHGIDQLYGNQMTNVTQQPTKNMQARWGIDRK